MTTRVARQDDELDARTAGDDLFAGPGEMCSLCRDFDWAQTPLGSTATWPLSLRTLAKTLLASRQPMFLFWGPELIQLYNDAYRPSFGGGGRHPRALGARGETFWTDIWHIIGPEIDQVMSGGAATWHEDALVPIERNGRLEEVYWTYSYSPAYDDAGRVAGVLVVCLETTPRVFSARENERLLHELETQAEELRATTEKLAERTDVAERAQQEAESANRSKGDFLAVMSHELRTPLNAIGGYAELLELGLRGPVTDAQRADLGRIQQSQKHLLGLINQVLNYTRIETGSVRYELADVRVADALAAAEALVVPQIRSKGLTYVLGECDPAMRVRADREKLQQVLLNVLTNAIKFTNVGGRIGVACSSDGQSISIAVEDTGVGIASDKLSVIFEPFVQVDAKLTRREEGVGLGLAISRDLARGMGGDITAISAEGAGSTFTVSLPRA